MAAAAGTLLRGPSEDLERLVYILLYDAVWECRAMNIRVGAYEARTKLPELLRGAQSGKSYTITHRGRAIAELVPVPALKQRRAAAAIEEWKRHMAKRPPIRGVDIKALIEYGRR